MIRISAALAFVFLAIQLAVAAPVSILVLGDSLTAGLGLQASEAFPARLEAALKAKGLDVRIVNAGVSGDTAAAGLARLDWALTDDVDGLIVELGANDALRGLDPAQTEAALDAILARATARKLPVLMAGMQAPPNLGPDYGAAFDVIYPRLAEKHGAILYPFFLDGVAAQPSLNQTDGIHPNGKGVDIIVERIMPSVEGLIRRAAQN
ncbi:MAG: arylesterase [Hyphomicrobiales bacterium]